MRYLSERPLNTASELVDPANLCVVFVSPRQRAHKTFHLLFDHLPELPAHVATSTVREWDYGDYEGLDAKAIKEKRGPDAVTWDIWRHGCPGGESTEEMASRVDDVVAKVILDAFNE